MGTRRLRDLPLGRPLFAVFHRTHCPWPGVEAVAPKPTKFRSNSNRYPAPQSLLPPPPSTPASTGTPHPHPQGQAQALERKLLSL